MPFSWPRPALAIGASALLVLPACDAPPSPAAAPRVAPSAPTGTAGTVPPDPHIGAVFPAGSATHTCAAAVVHSNNGNLIVTAAHCLAGGVPATFVPGFADNADPAGTWTIDAVYLDPRWLANADPAADYAIARVGGGAESLESRIGGGLTLGASPRVGTQVTITGYPLGVGGPPIGCQGPAGRTPDGFPSLKCSGFVDGTSGAPWRSGAAVVGVIGGLHGGGCDGDVNSYSSPFDDGVAKLLARADAGAPADTPPQAFTNDCR